MINRLLFSIVLLLLCSCSVLSGAYTLDDLIAYGLRHSTLIKKSKAQIALAEAKRKESKASQLGSIDLVGNYTHYNLPRTLAPLTPGSILNDPAGVPTTKDLFTTGVTYTVPLFTGFSQLRQVEIDTIAQMLAKNKFALSKQQLAYNVASLYVTILALEQMTKAQNQYIKALQSLIKIIKEEVELGKKASLDLLKAESDLQSAISYKEVLKGNIEITKASLAALVGLRKIERLKPIRVKVKKPNFTIDQLSQRLKTLHKIRIAELNVKKAEKMIQKTKSVRYPHVTMSSYYGYNYGKNDSSNKNPDDFNSEKNWNVGLNAKWTLFDFGKSDAMLQRAKINKLEAQYDKEQTLRDLHKSLVEAYEKLEQAYAHYRRANKEYQLAKASAKIELVRYKNGAATINDLLLAKSRAHIAKAKLIEDKYNYQKAKYYMDYILEKGVR